MIKTHYKVQFCLFVICLFFIGLGIFDTLNEELKTGMDLFRQFSHFVPFMTGAVIFGNNLHFKRMENLKS
ncbi:hypothetical protein EV144_102383 [Flavobacterium sp. 270]|nr:hypothetical protein EV144_102383 [Flavobacterium sp. 270]